VIEGVQIFAHPDQALDLWKNLHEVNNTPRIDFLRWYGKHVTFPVRDFTPPPVRGTLALVLGIDVARSLGLSDVLIDEQVDLDGVRWRVVPHPSGRNFWYNEPAHRLVVGLLLEEMLG
jgi:hypothetical protein